MLVNIFNSVLANTPGEADGLTSLAVWIVACIIFVFLSFLSYVFILVRMKMPKTVEPAMMKMSEEKEKRFLDLDILFLIINSAMFLLFLSGYSLLELIVE